MKIQKYVAIALILLGVLPASLVAMDQNKRRDLLVMQRESLNTKLSTAADDDEQGRILAAIETLDEEMEQLGSSDNDEDGREDDEFDSDNDQPNLALEQKIEQEQKERKQREDENMRLRRVKQDYDEIYSKPFKPNKSEGATVASQLAILKERHAKFAENSFEFQYTDMLMARCRAVIDPKSQDLFMEFMRALQRIDKQRFVKTKLHPEGLVKTDNEMFRTVSHMALTAYNQRNVFALRTMFARHFSHEAHTDVLKKINDKIDARLVSIEEQAKQNRERQHEQSEDDRKVAQELQEELGGVDAKIMHHDAMVGVDQSDLQAALKASMDDQEQLVGQQEAHFGSGRGNVSHDAQLQAALEASQLEVLRKAKEDADIAQALKEQEDADIAQTLQASLQTALQQKQASRDEYLVWHSNMKARIGACQAMFGKTVPKWR